jgi:hypothetical protein
MNKRILGGVIATLLAFAGLGAVATSASANALCNFTQGYYKNHLVNGEVAPNDLNGEGDEMGTLPAPGLLVPGATSYVQILKMPANGDARIIASYQVIATALNGFAVNTSDAVKDAYGDLVTYLRGDGPVLSRAEIIADAAILDQYNNGLLGVPHCS